MAKESNSKTSKRQALTSPLRTITISTHDIEATKKLYIDMLRMVASGPKEINEEQKSKLRLFWDIPEQIDFDVYHFTQSEQQTKIDIRAILLSEETESIHRSGAEKEVGPYALGFNVNNIEKLKALSGISNLKNLDISHTSEAYISVDTDIQKDMLLFSDDEGVRLSFLSSQQESLIGEDNWPINDNDHQLDHAILMTDRSDEEVIFYTHVLGYDLTSDLQSVSKNKDPEAEHQKVHYRSSTLKSADDESTSICLLSYNEDDIKAGPSAIRLPNRGIVMWTMQTRDIGEILARAHAKQIKVYRTPRKITDPIKGDIISMMLLSPCGFIVEVFSPF